MRYAPYSSFPDEPPGDSDFGRPGQRVSAYSGQTATTGVGTSWVTYPKMYSASCRARGGATWLEVRDMASKRGSRPRVPSS
jgi:hypothetical protein